MTLFSLRNEKKKKNIFFFFFFFLGQKYYMNVMVIVTHCVHCKFYILFTVQHAILFTVCCANLSVMYLIEVKYCNVIHVTGPQTAVLA